MTLVWKLSTDGFTESFPLPVISVTTTETGSTILSCVNTELRGEKILKASKFYQRLKADPKEPCELLLYYVNPVSNEMLGYYLEFNLEELTSSIDSAMYDFSIAGSPIIKIAFTYSLMPFLSDK